jgi:hypothetical protein
MKRALCTIVAIAMVAAWAAQAQQPPRSKVTVSGELRQWHKVTVTLDGPAADESAVAPNPFMDFRMTVTFAHESGAPVFVVPGYFAGDGKASESSATSGNQWRAHFSPDKVGRWSWRIGFLSGKGVAVDTIAAANAESVAPFDGMQGTLEIAASNKVAPDFRARGRLEYVGARYLRFAGTGEYFLKMGTDAPETLLAYADFDNTTALKPSVPLKAYAPHVADWKTGDPSWKGGKGKGLIGALNYLSSKGANSISFIPYNAAGDGDDVWPFVTRNDKFHYDVSKLDQWQIVFDHAQARGLYLHFKLQETENDDNVRGNPSTPARAGGARGAGPAGPVVESLDGGELGPERKLYLRELIARFGYSLALNWNLGEENTQSTDERRAMARYIRETDPYHHHIVLHTFPDQQEAAYQPLLGEQSVLTGVSLQSAYDHVHERTWRWVTASERAGKPWVVANDEEGPSTYGVPPDPGYKGFDGKDANGRAAPYSLHEIRKYTLWGNLMAGGAGVEYYFGYLFADNDLVAENFRSRDKSWDYGRIALDFFRTQRVPFWTLTSADELVGNESRSNSRYCLANAGTLYLVYLPSGGTAQLNLAGATGTFSVSWFDPRNGGALRKGAIATVTAGASVSLGAPPDHPADDWLIVVRKS